LAKIHEVSGQSTRFFMSNSIFRLSLELLNLECNLSLKVAY